MTKYNEKSTVLNTTASVRFQNYFSYPRHEIEAIQYSHTQRRMLKLQRKPSMLLDEVDTKIMALTPHVTYPSSHLQEMPYCHILSRTLSIDYIFQQPLDIVIIPNHSCACQTNDHAYRSKRLTN